MLAFTVCPITVKFSLSNSVFLQFPSVATAGETKNCQPQEAGSSSGVQTPGAIRNPNIQWPIVLYKNHLRTQTHKRHKKYCFVYPFMLYTKTISGHKHIYAIKILFCLPLHVLYNNHLRTQTHKSHKKYCFVFPFMFSSIDSHLQRENYVHLESYVNFT